MKVNSKEKRNQKGFTWDSWLRKKKYKNLGCTHLHNVAPSKVSSSLI